MPRIYPPRTYAPAWEACKATGFVRLRVAPHHLRKVKRALIKEKDEDKVYKLEVDITCANLRMLSFSYNRETWELKAELKAYTRITIHDLV